MNDQGEPLSEGPQIITIAGTVFYRKHLPYQERISAPGMDSEVAFQNKIEVFLPLGRQIRKDLVHLGNNSPEEACGNQENSDAVSLPTKRQSEAWDEINRRPLHTHTSSSVRM
jgi:hypothetical protein